MYRNCAGAVISRTRGGLREVIIAKRTDQSRDAWQFPQGGVEANETAQAASVREANEELGIPPNELRLIRQLGEPVRYETPNSTWLNKSGYAGQEITWFLYDWNGDIRNCVIDVAHDGPGSQPEFCQVKWMDIRSWEEELAPYVAPFKSSMYKQLHQELLQPIQK